MNSCPCRRKRRMEFRGIGSPILLWIFLSLLPRTCGFANWLKCYVDLDPSEVIMNYHVLPAEKSPYPNIHLEVTWPVGSEWRSGDVITMDENDLKVFDGLIVVRLSIEDEPSLTEDLEYVVDILSGGARFVQKGSLCQGKRRTGRDPRTEEFLVEVNDPNFREPLQLVAGWATGHEAVKLTPTLTIQRINSEPYGGGVEDEL